ncbi:hypothetical protein [Faecalibaculum rodentium]|uniref:hypothetical protein n=1 Tax=Faecalibaculum rodentium TaxID=1702221 RepID=UPI001C3D4524|nr:hypothetical protein [Faecalibaculum rodentium]
MNHVAQTVIPVAGGLDVHKSFVVAVIKSTSDQGTVNTVKKGSRPFVQIWKTCGTGSCRMTAIMSAWNRPENTGYRSITSLRQPWMKWSYVKKTDTDFRESADTANSTKDFLRFLP